MDNYDPWELYNAFLNQCTCDKNNIKEIYKRFRIKILACGRHLLQKDILWSYYIPEDNTAAYHLEFLDFIDGNGFEVRQAEPNRYQIMPRYPETKAATANPKICTYKWE